MTKENKAVNHFTVADEYVENKVNTSFYLPISTNQYITLHSISLFTLHFHQITLYLHQVRTFN